MPHKIKLDGPHVGYALTAARNGDTVTVETCGFYCDEDGDALVRRLDGLSSLLNRLPPSYPRKPSSVDHLLAVMDRSGTTTLFVNELPIVLSVRTKRPIKAGEELFGDDIADVSALDFEGLATPKDHGVLFFFTVGWRRGFYFDLAPLQYGKGEPRDYNVQAVLGQCWAYLQFQDYFKITDDAFDRMVGQSWFPFVHFKGSTIRQLISYAQNGWTIDDLPPTIAQEVSERIPQWLLDWKASSVFAPHDALLSQAAQRFLDGDFISATSILYPRIEGVLRTHHKACGATTSATAKNLIDQAIRPAPGHLSLLLPARFHRYVTDVCFANFDPSAHSVPVSRNSVAHGVARAEDYTQKAAVVGLLTLAQLFFYLNPLRDPGIPVGTSLTAASS